MRARVLRVRSRPDLLPGEGTGPDNDRSELPRIVLCALQAGGDVRQVENRVHKACVNQVLGDNFRLEVIPSFNQSIGVRCDIRCDIRVTSRWTSAMITFGFLSGPVVVVVVVVIVVVVVVIVDRNVTLF